MFIPMRKEFFTRGLSARVRRSSLRVGAPCIREIGRAQSRQNLEMTISSPSVGSAAPRCAQAQTIGLPQAVQKP